MTAIKHKLVVDSQGEPQEVIIPWSAYIELAETFGWDLSELEQKQLADALRDSREQNRGAFVGIEDLE